MLDYQSPNGTWYPYSFLQGNRVTTSTGTDLTTTWISTPGVNLIAMNSLYGVNPNPSPTPTPGTTPITAVAWLPAATPTPSPSPVSTPMAWTITNLAKAPMMAKADARSIRYNTQVGVIDVSNPNPAPTASPVPTPWSAGVLGSIWPAGYQTPPIMTPGSNPVSYSQSEGDYGPSAGNPYNENSSSTTGDSVRPIIMNRPFRSVGEMGYAFRDQPFKTLDFSSATSADNGLLDLFTINENETTTATRAGVINLNTQQDRPLAALLARTILAEGIEGANPSPSPIPNTSATPAATSLVTATNSVPLQNKAELAKWIATQGILGATLPKTYREALARAFGEDTQTRTWNLMIDVIAQSGRYPPNASAGPNTANPLANFIVQGEQRYWVHVAIDRFTGQVIDKQIEVVNE
jgi:hypothetical protein